MMMDDRYYVVIVMTFRLSHTQQYLNSIRSNITVHQKTLSLISLVCMPTI